VILGHHYQRADVYKHAQLTGDSLRLSKLASQTDAEYIVFCGVHFMAEVADILSKPYQKAILPDLAAGCSMADMANLAKVERAWRELSEVLDPDEKVTPVTYINSAFGRREKVLFFPDQHLGRWTGYLMDIPLSQMLVWDPDEPMGGLTAQQIKMAKVLLWKGHCSVHQMFQAQHILRWRQQNPSGVVISHPECNFEVCKLSDYVGSTDFIIKTIASSAPGTRWLVGTELNLVNRVAEQFKSQGKVVQFMAPTVCMCSTMARIDPQHLAWALENLVGGKVVNQIKVPAHEAELARIALDRMLAVS
jgi:quinolinate synthase